MEVESIRIIEDEIIEEFSHFDDWMDKYNYLIEMGKEIPLIDPKFKIENKPDKERRAWARILIQAINSYGKLLESETLEMRVEDLEKKLKNGVLIPLEKRK